MGDFAITPDKWGKYGWTFLHFATLAYPIDPTSTDKLNMLTFIDSFGKILPCTKCRFNFKNNLLILPLTEQVLSSRSNLVSWASDMHNLVNKELGKKIYSKEEIKDMLENMVNGKTYSYAAALIIIVLVVALVLIYYNSDRSVKSI